MLNRWLPVLRVALIALLLGMISQVYADSDKGRHWKDRDYEREEYEEEYEEEYKYKGGKRGRHDDDEGRYKAKSKYKYKYKRKGGPPPWAPAHGYRAKYGARDERYDEEYYVEYERRTREYGIPDGRCNRKALGGVVGGAIGGIIGSNIGKGDGRTLATIAGTLVGYLVGSSIGQDMDEADRQCTGQALERAADNQAIAWRNPDTGADYRVTPSRTFKQADRYCREYVTEARFGEGIRRVSGTACRNPDGTWQMVD